MSGRLYNAYPSDSESDTDSASTDYTQRSDVTEKYLLNIPGTKPPVTSGYDAPGMEYNPPDNAGTKIKFTPIENTSLFMLNSRDRDTKVYPQPTFFTLRLPRVYKNVKSIKLNQINLLNSFFNFTAAQQNTFVYVYEAGRVLSDGSSNIVKVQIRDGTYNAGDLVTELTNALNSTPLFANITFTNFFQKFQTNGDYTLLFNTPGEIVYNSLTNTYDYNVSMSQIVGRYFQTSQTLGNTSFTYNQSLVAYYYPIIKEMIIASNVTIPFSTVGLPIPTGFTSWYDYIVYGFQGLNDPNILAIASDLTNQDIFGTYHYQNTFNTFLVNQYTCTYNTQQGRLVIAAPSLNTSIATDLTNEYTNILNALITASSNFTSIDQFNAGYANLQNSNSVLTSFYNWFQGQFTSNFGINFGTYSADFYGNSNNNIALYNTLNEFGWNLSLSPAVSLSQISATPPGIQSSNYWSNIIISKTANIPAVSTFVSTINLGQLNFSNASESQYGYTDISFSILPVSYIRTTFKTPCRQDLNFMTIPRYINERGPGTQEVYNFNIHNSTPSLLFDVRNSPNVYILTDVSGNTLFNMYTIYQNMFNSADYMRAFNEWQVYIYNQILSGVRAQPLSPSFNSRPPLNDIGLTSYRPFIFFQVNADEYPISPDAYFNITFYVESQDNTPFSVPIRITWYKDRAAFMADATLALPSINPNVESARNYFQTQTYPAGTTSAQMVVPVRNLQQTYFYVHFTESTNQPSVNLRVFSLLTNDYGQYTQATQNDKLDMPYQNLPSIYDQYTPDSTSYDNNLVSIYSTSVTSIGYDVSGVSNNLMDYIIVAPNLNYYDPDNIQDYVNGLSSGIRYQFNLSNVGAPQPGPTLVPPWSLYFGSNSKNTILDLYQPNQLVYLSSLQTQILASTFKNETLIATLFDPTQPQNKEIYLNPTQDPYMPIDPSTIFQPCINYGTPLVTDASTCLAFSDTSGISGVSFFLPPNNVYTFNEIIVKFAYTAPAQTNNFSNITRQESPFYYYSTLGILGNYSYNNWLYNNRGSSTLIPLVYQTGYVPIGQQYGYAWQYDNFPFPYFAIGPNAFNNALISILGTYENPVPPYSYYVVMTQKSTNNSYTINIQGGYASLSDNYAEFLNNNQTITYPYFPDGTLVNFQFYTTQNNSWDDWYLWNRINTKIGIFPTAQIQSTNTTTLSLSSALFTMTLNKVTQVCQNTNRAGTLHTREPDWGTYYQYTVMSTPTTVWAPLNTNISTQFSTISAPADITPTYISGSNTYPNYALSEDQIYNYNYLARSYGIAPSVGTAVNNPYSGISSYTADIPNSYTAVPFSYNTSTSQWQVGSFYALSFTRQPVLPSTGLIGASPYYGPPGIFAWHTSNNLFSLYNGEQANFQPYYWLGKISIDVLENIQYNPATDLSAFGGYAGLSGEYQDTQMFIYKNTTIGADYRDISTSRNRWQWGNEQNSNYIAYDDQSGYNYLSYVYQQFVTPYIPEYAVHVRSYDPIAKFNTGLRIIGKNYTDFGTPTLGDISIEISSLKGYTPISETMGSYYVQNTSSYLVAISTNNGIRLNNGNRFSHDYADALVNFNTQCQVSSITFGTTNTFAGTDFTFSGYSDALSQYTTYYSTVKGEYVAYTTLLSTATSLMNEYIIFRYGNILPPSFLTRTQYTAPIPFQFLFTYNLKDPYISQYDEWGLGWYLGFMKQTTPIYGPRTLIKSDTFIRIVQNYIYLKLNTSQNINTLAVSAKEDLSQTRESQGMDTQYFTKVILNDFGNYSRAGVQLDKLFAPVLGKYEIIECQLTDKNGNVINNTDCDYDMVIEITEISNMPTNDSSLIGPNIDKANANTLINMPTRRTTTATDMSTIQ